MARSARLSAALLCLAALVACDGPATDPAPRTSADDAEPTAFAHEEADIATLQAQMKSGAIDSHALTQAYLDRIAAIDDAGPMLNAVIELNPDAISETAR